jgi:hypothetical protein
VCVPNHGMAIGDLILCNAWWYARCSLSAARIPSSFAKSCFSFLVRSHVRISCESDCNAATIADMDEKFWDFLHSWENEYGINSVNEKSVGDGSTSAIRTKDLNLVERFFTSLGLVEAYQRQLN